MKIVRPHEVTEHDNYLWCACLVAGHLCCSRPHDDGTERGLIFVHSRNVARALRGDGHP